MHKFNPDDISRLPKINTFGLTIDHIPNSMSKYANIVKERLDPYIKNDLTKYFTFTDLAHILGLEVPHKITSKGIYKLIRFVEAYDHFMKLPKNAASGTAFGTIYNSLPELFDSRYSIDIISHIPNQFLDFLKRVPPSKVFDNELTNLAFDYNSDRDKDITQRRRALWKKDKAAEERAEYEGQEAERIAAEKAAYEQQRKEELARQKEARDKALGFENGESWWDRIFKERQAPPEYKKNIYNPRFYDATNQNRSYTPDEENSTEGQIPDMSNSKTNSKLNEDKYLQKLKRKIIKEPTLDWDNTSTYQPFNAAAYSTEKERKEGLEHHKAYQAERLKDINDELNLIDRVRTLNYAANAFNKGMNKESGQEIFEKILKKQLGQTGRFIDEYEKKYKKARYNEEKQKNTSLGAHDFYNAFRGETTSTPNGKPTLGAIMAAMNAANNAMTKGPF
jgi:hypothetical protein